MARYQTTQATCGATAVLNALSALEHQVTEDQVISASGIKDPTRGLGQREIKRALVSLGYSWSEIWTGNPQHAWLALRDSLTFRGRPVIMAVDVDRHWLAGVGCLGGRVALADGAHTDMVIFRDEAAVMGRWNSGARRGFYGLVIEPAERDQ